MNDPLTQPQYVDASINLKPNDTANFYFTQ